MYQLHPFIARQTVPLIFYAELKKNGKIESVGCWSTSETELNGERMCSGKKNRVLGGWMRNRVNKLQAGRYDAVHWFFFLYRFHVSMPSIRCCCAAHMDESSFFIDASSLALFIRYFWLRVFFSLSLSLIFLIWPVVVVCTHWRLLNQSLVRIWNFVCRRIHKITAQNLLRL